MKRMSLPGLVLAVSLALLLPLELAHCVWMGMPSTASAGKVSASAAHACCRAAATSGPARPASSPAAARACTCIQLPIVTLPSPPAVEAPSLGAVHFLMATPACVPAPVVPAVTANVRAPGVDRPPYRADLNAHGMRAPPITA